ncbi:MAG TPA: acyl-CoA dehydrogenase family protein [Polyangiaceae bacterium]|jgi:alkylation response protein AidB-like acyl-CoA dehydrogenase|nr:MAG: Acyl-CoA dehydrogenase [Deltaproteobacteria bacterium ADurb.Bin207]HNS96907.1 acyl-CoA dehydrogenase family protein [Polyangiaceae bacterium]HNZ21061.1 acyl-CoA dehydrogenase family protein [Polyangiaceae bacterium]HOD22314.1 acyl-CoA dehydrogenase family protein [Polyangiaceae bacterium]HOE47831.1 acyl-CoA dehydrogenase family protein [Polyangiaceae bacterium]
MSANYFLDNKDLRFQFEHGIDWKEIVELTEAGFKLPDGHASLEDAKEFYAMVMESVGEFAGDFIAPRALKIDTQGNHLVDGKVVSGEALVEVYEGLRDRELLGMPIPRELGGSNCPMCVFFATGEVLGRADVSVMTHFGFHGGIGLALLMYAAHEGSLQVENGQVTQTRWDDVIREIAAGQSWGAMVLTEPDAGSDLGRIRAKAEKRDGKWYLTGEKIFITSGHGQWHIVLAKTDIDDPKAKKDPLKQLSLFMVPQMIERDGETIRNFEVTKVEEKVGHHGSATCSLQYENSECELIGKEGEGFKLMLTLMNNARVGVGFESIGVCEAAVRQAREYAAQRVTMGQTIDHHPIVAEMLMDMELDIVGLRALAFSAANCVELASKLEMKLLSDPPTDPDERKAMKRKAKKYGMQGRLLTPLLKYAAAEAAVRIARQNMQVIGGPGYISEIGADKLLRDALVLPVYEGTSQIQALMCLKDNMTQALSKPGPFARDAARLTFLATTAHDETEKLFYKAEASLHQAMLTILARIASNKLRRTVADKGITEIGQFAKMSNWDPKTDFTQGLMHAERFTRAKADVEMARILLQQAKEFPERRLIAERFMRRMAPRVAKEVDAILSNDTTVLDWIADLDKQS